MKSYKSNTSKNSAGIRESSPRQNTRVRDLNENSIKPIKTPKFLKRSLIPRFKYCKTNTKDAQEKKEKIPNSQKILVPSNIEKKYNINLQKIEEKEKSIAECCTRLEMLMQKIVEKKSTEKFVLHHCKNGRNQLARKMISDPLVFEKEKFNKSSPDIFNEYQHETSQNSGAWFKTSGDILSNMLKNLNNAEAKRVLDGDIVKYEDKNNNNNKTKQQLKINAAEFSHFKDLIKNPGKPSLNEVENVPLGFRHFLITKAIDEGGDLTEKLTSDLDVEKKNEGISVAVLKDVQSTQEGTEETDIWTKELERNKKSATNLRNGVFELQKTCNECSLKCNDIQLRLISFSKKIQWDQLLLRKINGIESSEVNKGMSENENQEMEIKMKKLDDELDVLIKLNCILLQQKLLLDDHINFKFAPNWQPTSEYNDITIMSKNLETQRHTAETIINEKQNVINHLSGLLDVMKTQENFSRNRKSMMESRIEELKKLNTF